jgi:hypothetical protein
MVLWKLKITYTMIEGGVVVDGEITRVGERMEGEDG